MSDALEQTDQRIGLLSSVERNWTASAAPQQLRHRRSARIALRFVLLQAGVAGARGQLLSEDRHGKPALARSELAFNVSHSGNKALLVVATSGPVGIDLETPRSVSLGRARQDLIVAAARVFVSKPGQEIEFLEAWTCLEAFAKARGTGIGALLTELGITAQGVRTLTASQIAARASVLLTSSGLAVSSLELPDRITGAVAGPMSLLRTGPVWRWLTDQELRDFHGAA